MHSPDEVDNLKSGAIVVARMTDPTWYPVFPLAGGIVTEIGGWLSHTAIVARECNLTAIVGVRSASEVLRTGDLVRLTADGRVERVKERRRPGSALRDRPGGEAHAGASFSTIAQRSSAA